MINELDIKYFLCLAETLNFSEVGKQMYISQQAVSKRIAGLESDLGVRLFFRSRNGVVLTAAGRKYYNFFRTAADEFRALQAEVEEKQHTSIKQIHMGYQNWVDCGPAQGTAMAALRQDFPNVYLLGERHSPSKLVELLASGELDIILIHKRFIPKLKNVNKLPLITTPMQVVVSKYNPLNKDGADYRVFCESPMLIDALEGESEEASVMRAYQESRRYGFRPSSITVVPNRDSIYTAAELNQGIFFSSFMAVLQGTSLVRYTTDVQETLYCVWRTQYDDMYLELYAKQLQKEYKALTAKYLETREWE